MPAPFLPAWPPADRALFRLAEALRVSRYHFVTVSPATYARVNARRGNGQARSLEDVFGWSRPFEASLLPEDLLTWMKEAGVLVEDRGLLKSLVRASSLAGELFLHSAYPTVASDAVFFGPDTYRFARAIEAGLRARPVPVRRAVDIGCGAGPGGVLVAKALPQASVAMVDINEAALRLARINAALTGAHNATTCRSDLLSSLEGSFDLIVANPPYLNDPLKRAYRHGGGPLGAGLSGAILDAALERLAPAGTLILYTGVAVVNGDDPFRADVAAKLSSANVSWSYEEVDPDVFGEELETAAYAGADRIAAVVLTATKSR